MNTLSLNQMETFAGGNWVDKACGVIGVGSTIYGVGLLFNWWNPVGWIDGAALVLGGACGIYSLVS